MPRTKKAKSDRVTPGRDRIYRYWVEIRDKQSGSVRELPLTAITIIPLPRRRTDPDRPSKQMLRLQDDVDTVECETFDELVMTLRERYPDDSFERNLKMQRDEAAERKKAEAIRQLVELIANAALEEVLRDGAMVPTAATNNDLRRP